MTRVEGHTFSSSASEENHSVGNFQPVRDCAPWKKKPCSFNAGYHTLGWLLFLFTVVFVYAVSFSDVPVIASKYDVLADADAASFILLLKNFQFDEQLGNPWNTQNRSVADAAQKHKIHHVIYAAFGHAIYKVLGNFYELLGVGRERAVYGVNAIIAGINIYILALLLRRNNPHGNPTFPFILFYCLALSTWIYSSIPESWPFTATLVLCFLLLLHGRPVRPLLLGGVLGLIMLNNVLLAALSSLVIFVVASENLNISVALRKILGTGLVALVVWLGGLTLLSLFDTGFRPDNFVRYTLWFKQFTNPSLPLTDPYVWKSAGTNLFINSIVSNQPDASMPQEALQATLRSSMLGTLAIVTYLALVCVAMFSFIRTTAAAVRNGGILGLTNAPSIMFALWGSVMLAVTVVLYYPSGFLYSTTVVPVISILFCRHINLRIPWQRVLLLATITVALANNVEQIIKFRHVLSAM
jgi:hypothetical protein